MNDNLHNQIHEAAEKLKKAVEDMGCTDVTISYAYNKEKSVHTGGVYTNILEAIGALELMKHDLLQDKDE
jgi:hypothetical protein